MRERKRYHQQKSEMIPKSIPKSIKINAESMLEEMMQQTYRIIYNRVQKGPYIHSNQEKQDTKNDTQKRGAPAKALGDSASRMRATSLDSNIS